MGLNEDLDEVLVVDWRSGTSSAKKLTVELWPEQQQQSILPFRQKKAISSSDTATSDKMTTMLDVVKKESSSKASGGVDRIAAPEFYVLSDSESTEAPKMLDPAVKAMRDCLLRPGPICPSKEEKRLRSSVQPEFHNLSSDEDGSDTDPDWLRLDVDPISRRNSLSGGPSSPLHCRVGEPAQQFSTNSGGNGGLSDHNAGKKRPLSHLPGFESHDNAGERKMKNSLVKPPIFELSSDDENCASDPPWMRDYSAVPVRNSVNIGQGSPEQSLPKSFGNNAVVDRLLDRRRASVQIRGFESPENCEISIPPSVNELESDEDAAPKRKRGRARKGPVSEEELAAREAQKQRDREFKIAQKEEEKRAREKKKEELKRQKEASKMEDAERRRLEKETEKWRKGKFALQNTTVHLHPGIMRMNPLGYLLLQQLNSKNYPLKCEDPSQIERTIIWTIKRPSADSKVDTEGLGSQADSVMNSQPSSSQVQLEEVEMEYVVIVFQGDEFAKMVADNELEAHLSTIRERYPTYTICYLISGLKKYLNKKEQLQYRTGDQTWTRPNVEQALAQFITHHVGVNARLCIDESEIADHVAGLTKSLAEFPSKKKLTAISLGANGEHVKKSDPNNHIIKKSTWLKFLVALGGVSGHAAIAVANQYPTMRSLLKAYLDPSRSVCDKEKLLEDLQKDVSDRKRVGPAVSKRIYRIFMAKDGNLSAQDVVDGADHFT